MNLTLTQHSFVLRLSLFKEGFPSRAEHPKKKKTGSSFPHVLIPCLPPTANTGNEGSMWRWGSAVNAILPERRDQCSSHDNTIQPHSNVYDYTSPVNTHLPPHYKLCFCREGRCGREQLGSPVQTGSAGATPALLGGTVSLAPPCSTCGGRVKEGEQLIGQMELKP